MEGRSFLVESVGVVMDLDHSCTVREIFAEIGSSKETVGRILICDFNIKN